MSALRTLAAGHSSEMGLLSDMYLFMADITNPDFLV